ncbi:hypothetical protein [Streptomyces cinereoruber]|uniref:hypothetical protein n=1 Tax=Streptomyces cinereoruber TaxID=67260 RepID=UPI003C30C58E
MPTPTTHDGTEPADRTQGEGEPPVCPAGGPMRDTRLATIDAEHLAHAHRPTEFLSW